MITIVTPLSGAAPARVPAVLEPLNPGSSVSVTVHSPVQSVPDNLDQYNWAARSMTNGWVIADSR